MIKTKKYKVNKIQFFIFKIDKKYKVYQNSISYKLVTKKKVRHGRRRNSPSNKTVKFVMQKLNNRSPMLFFIIFQFIHYALHRSSQLINHSIRLKLVQFSIIKLIRLTWNSNNPKLICVPGNGRTMKKMYDGLLLDAGGTLLQLAKPVENVYASIGRKYG